MKNFLALILILFVLAGAPLQTAVAQTRAKNSGNKTNSSTTATVTAPRFGNTDGITAQQMKDYLTFIASDELEGRDTPSRGLDIAAMYIASHLAKWGIKPAGDGGSYFQKFPLRRVKIDAQNTRLELNNQSFVYGEDFLANFTPGSIAASEIVYASHGWVLKSKNINPYQGIDVRDKIVVVTNNLPKGVTFNDLQGKPGDDWFSPPLYAQANGAKAVISFVGFGGLSNWKGNLWTQTEKGGVEFGKPQTQITIPTITAGARLIAALFQGEKSSGGNTFNKAIAGEPVDAFALNPNKKINLSVAVKTENIHSQNVVGILEGSDPVLKNEYVAIGAHYDHVGMNPFAAGADKIWNGADDDGSGTVAVLAMAEAFSKGAQRPKRSILFIWHAGEEKGLWGSEYYADNPTVPINSIIAQLNIDMIGRAQKLNEEVKPRNKELTKQGEVYLIGSKMMSTELGELSESVNNSFLKMSFNYRYDDPKDPQQFFYRSDHYNYAKKGIPIIFYMDGDHEDYHQPSDSVEKIDFEQMEKIARTIFATGWELANRPARPKVDKPLSAQQMGN
ncbi:MAG: M20/M25/M40 family metallo-hydrolase [Acidobacteriota bacterium]|nr:M20/M25/M40 family metallo-hydrolase [Acidobacteriota bacterium]